MAKGDYCTIEEVELYLQTDLQIDNPSVTRQDRELIEFLIPRKSDYIDRYCNRVNGFYTENYVELISGNNTSKILLENYPVNSISNLYIGVTLDPGTTAIDIANYSFKEYGEVYYKYGFAKGYENIQANYNSGYADKDSLPLDLNLVCIQLVVQAFNNTKRDNNVKQIKEGDQSVTFFDKTQLSSEQQELLDTYKRYDF